MRKKVIAIFSVFYFVASLGTTVSAHFCHGQIMDLEINGMAENCCHDTFQDAHCCDQKYVRFQLLSPDQVSSQKPGPGNNPFPMFAGLYSSTPPVDHVQEIMPETYSGLIAGPDLIILHCSFQLYG